ncbi:MAG: hypothetical protein HKO57_16690 [Akkermansiaceae bacterium]|nr:hypothetical protein [Akkermansiaceae bacterium]
MTLLTIGAVAAAALLIFLMTVHTAVGAPRDESAPQAATDPGALLRGHAGLRPIHHDRYQRPVRDRNCGGRSGLGMMNHGHAAASRH